MPHRAPSNKRLLLTLPVVDGPDTCSRCARMCGQTASRQHFFQTSWRRTEAWPKFPFNALPLGRHTLGGNQGRGSGREVWLWWVGFGRIYGKEAMVWWKEGHSPNQGTLPLHSRNRRQPHNARPRPHPSHHYHQTPPPPTITFHFAHSPAPTDS
jgi:hypothetical protein